MSGRPPTSRPACRACEVDQRAADLNGRLEVGHAHDLLAVQAPQQCGHRIFVDDQQRRRGDLAWLGVTQRSVTDQPEVGSLGALLLEGAHIVVSAAADGAVAGLALAGVCLHVETGLDDLAHRFEVQAHLAALPSPSGSIASRPSHISMRASMPSSSGARPGALQELTVEPVGRCGKTRSAHRRLGYAAAPRRERSATCPRRCSSRSGRPAAASLGRCASLSSSMPRSCRPPGLLPAAAPRRSAGPAPCPPARRQARPPRARAAA